jgi:hypothetical protein
LPDAAAVARLFVTLLVQAAGCDFKVAGRVAHAFAPVSAALPPAADAALNRFLTLEHLRHMIPSFSATMFCEISERDCRVDVSSSQLRAAAALAAGPSKL